MSQKTMRDAINEALHQAMEQVKDGIQWHLNTD